MHHQHSGQRIVYLDLLRCLVVAGALVSHALIKSGVSDRLATGALSSVGMLTRAALPSLLIVFGVILQIVYARRLSERPAEALASLLMRIGQCYLAFLLLAVIACMSGQISPVHLAGAPMLVSQVMFANIFKMYALFLAAAVPLLLIKRRWGGLALMVVPLGVAIFDVALVQLLPAWPRPLTHFGGFLFGFGDVFGPSILHALSLIVFGMAVGGTVFSQPAVCGDRAVFWIMLIGSFAILAAEILQVGLSGFVAAIIEYNGYRAHNSVVYFAYGIVASLVLIGVARAFAIVIRGPAGDYLHLLGRHTFFFFLWGNAILIAIPARTAELAGTGPVVPFVLALLAFTSWLTILWARHGRQHATYGHVHTSCQSWIRQRISVIARLSRRIPLGALNRLS